jgi:NAD(P)-dependent dehydrogenase (short-subunit alcohol dehydrogenase family)
MGLAAEPRAVVTGGGSGLGRAFCAEIARRGGRLVVADLNLAAAEETVGLLALADQRAIAVKCDVSRIEELEGVAKLADERFGGTDLIVNNAGVAVAGPMDQIPIEDWRWIVSVNLFGVIHGCKVFLPRFRAKGSGHILNVASAAGLVSTAEMSPYNMTKAGVVALSETLYTELLSTGIGVTVLCPTFFKTAIVKSGRTHGQQRDMAQVALALMERSKLQADGVARAALDAASRGHLYAVPMADGRWMWRLKRFAPELFHRRLVPSAMAMMRKRFASGST